MLHSNLSQTHHSIKELELSKSELKTKLDKSIKEIEKAFHDSVDDYLDMCKERKEEPDKPFSGRFLVRVSPDIHRKIHMSAKKAGLSINAWLNQNLHELTGKT